MGLAEVAVPHDSNILLLVICSAAVVTPDNKMILPHEPACLADMKTLHCLGQQ